MDYLHNTTDIYESIHDIIFKDEIDETDLFILKGLIENKPRNTIKLVLLILSKISKNHYRHQSFFQNMDKVLLSIKNEIKNNLSNFEIFDIFKGNKRIVLFLIQEKIIELNRAIINIMINDKYAKKNYPIYFYSEIKQFLSIELQNQIENSNAQIIEESLENFEDFNLKRMRGENDIYLCQLIQKDSVEEFISYTNKKNYHLSSKIEQSIFETNSFLIKNQPTLIEYSAFYGSIQIFRYLFNNEIELTPSLWIYAIHGNCPDIIHFLEDNNVIPKDESFEECLFESIKCHHNEIMNYLLDLHFSEKTNEISIVSRKIKYYNFPAFPKNLDNIEILYYLCKYNHISLVDLILQSYKININEIINDKQRNIADTLLNISIEKGNVEIVQILLKYPEINVNCVTTQIIYRRNIIEKKVIKSALYIAIEKGYFEIVKLLLNNKNLDINSESTFYYDTYRKYSENKSVLNFAIEKGSVEIVKLILNRPNLNIRLATLTFINERRDNMNIKIIKSPLITAIDEEQIEIVDLLLKNNNVDVNHQYLYEKQFQDYHTDDAVQKFLFL